MSSLFVYLFSGFRRLNSSPRVCMANSFPTAACPLYRATGVTRGGVHSGTQVTGRNGGDQRRMGSRWDRAQSLKHSLGRSAVASVSPRAGLVSREETSQRKHTVRPFLP